MEFIDKLKKGTTLVKAKLTIQSKRKKLIQDQDVREFLRIAHNYGQAFKMGSETYSYDCLIKDLERDL